MENNGIIKNLVYLTWGGTLFVLPFFVFGYSDSTTHPALTQEIIKFYNSHFPQKQINTTDTEIVIQGSIDEDEETRWLYHFYDPVYDRGLVLEDDAFPKDPNLAIVASGARSEWASSKTWGVDSSLQSGFFESLSAGIITEYFSGEKDYSWERAIYEYAWGDSVRGLSSLGHVLHLIEDASVPDHTRNDPHPPILDMGSPYEGWTAQFNRQNIALSLISEQPIILPDIGDYFDSLAKYSNNNFFSKDTILTNEYNKPQILRKDLNFAYGRDDLSSEFKLAKITTEFGSGQIEYTLDDKKREVLTDYWTRLSKQSVLHGAGVIKLFFDEVAEEKRTKALYNKNRSWLGKTYDAVSDTVSGWWDKTTDAMANTYNSISGSISNTWNNWSWSYTAPAESNLAGSILGLEPVVTGETQQLPPAPSTATSAVSPPPASAPLPATASAAAGASAGKPPVITQNTGTNFLPKVAGASIAVNPPPSNTSYIVPMAGGGGAPPTPANAGSGGQGLPPEINTETETPPATPAPEPPPPEPEPTPPSPEATEDKAEEPPQDTEAPDAIFNIIECANSISLENCVLTAGELNLEWSTSAGDLDYFTLECKTGPNPCPDFPSGQTTATGTQYTAPIQPGIYIFSLTAKDKTGNESAPKSIETGIYARPVVINEIAWAGTSADQSNDEWLELKNLTPYQISLNGWILRSASDNSPYIELSGEIALDGFFLLERTDDATISDIGADQIYTGALTNTGEVLELSLASTTMDKTPEIPDCGMWCGGNAPLYRSMERYEPENAGDRNENWGTWQEFLQNGKNADGLNINGTPKARNTMNYMISQTNGDIFFDKTLKKSTSPYVVTKFSVILPDKTLTIEPGVVVKFLPGNSALRTEGKIIAKGTPQEPIIFTSFRDDEYAGDTNQDADTSKAEPGDWKAIDLLGRGSELENTVIRYGGRRNLSADALGNLTAIDTDVILKNSILEKSATNGAHFINTSGIVGTSIFKSNNSAGLNLLTEAGELDIINSTFENNDTGLRLTGAGEVHGLNIRNNIFSGNSIYAVQSIGAYPEFSGNRAEGNKLNGILIYGTVTKDFELFPDLPYVVQNATYRVETGSKLTLHPGVLFKLRKNGGALLVRGSLEALGTDAEKVIFTSLRDDEYGGDTDATTTLTAEKGDWANIMFQDASAASTIRNTIIKYADSGISAINSRVELGNIIFSNNTVGITADASSTITNLGGNIFEDNDTNTIPSDIWP